MYLKASGIALTLLQESMNASLRGSPSRRTCPGALGMVLGRSPYGMPNLYHRILEVLADWVAGSYRPVDQQVFVQMKQFAMSLTSISMAECAKRVITTIKQHVCLLSILP